MRRFTNYAHTNANSHTTRAIASVAHQPQLIHYTHLQKLPMSALASDMKTGGFIKIVMDSENRILGATGIGAHAGEWVQCLTLAVKMGLKAEDIADTIFAYPTYAEIVKKSCSRFLRTLK